MYFPPLGWPEALDDALPELLRARLWASAFRDVRMIRLRALSVAVAAAVAIAVAFSLPSLSLERIARLLELLLRLALLLEPSPDFPGSACAASRASSASRARPRRGLREVPRRGPARELAGAFGELALLLAVLAELRAPPRRFFRISASLSSAHFTSPSSCRFASSTCFSATGIAA